MKKIVTLFSLLFSIVISAQNFTGQAVYQTKTSMDMDFGGREMTEQMRQQITEMMRRALEKTYILNFNQDESIYREEERLSTPGGGGGGFGMMMMGNFTAGPQYKNTKTNEFLQEQEFFGKQFLITDTLPKLEWTLVNESKQIGQYVVFKATAVKPLTDMDWQSFRRRNRENQQEDAEAKKDSTSINIMDEIEMPKEIVITAWYTPQIPVPQGPGEFHGLPGLILEVQADRTSILCTRIVLNPRNPENIRKPSRGQKVTQQEYQEIVREKVEEMQEMSGGRRGGGGMRFRMGG